MHRRGALLSVMCGLQGLQAQAAPDPQPLPQTALWQRLTQEPCLVLVRHANAPGVGDPPGFTLGRCETQRNLDAAGRQQAQALGRALARQRATPKAVWSSQWCRCQETARLAFGPKVVDQPAFNSFFADRTQDPVQTEQARQLLLGWRGPGVLVVVTHQVNITSLSSIYPASGEAVVLQAVGGELKLLGQLSPTQLQ
jgi:phosphohistidine phosphatase SixA